MDKNHDSSTMIRQTMYIMRHGLAYHNIPLSVENKTQLPNKRDPRYTDSKLVLPQAQQQARKAGEILKKTIQTGHNKATTSTDEINLDGVIVSPLSRCLETAYFVMDVLLNTGNKHDRLSQQTYSIPWICKEDLREAFGIHYSDKRSYKSTLQENWPFVQFDVEMPETDELWKPDRRESIHDVHQRIESFLVWLSWVCLQHEISHNESFTVYLGGTTSKVKKFLVVSHGVWIECLLHRFSPQVLDGGKRVHNCDLYRVDLVCEWKQNNSGEWICKNISLEHVSFLH